MRTRRIAVAFAAVAAIAAIVGVTAYATGLLRGVELDSIDARFSIRGAQTPSEQVVVVKIDDVSFEELGKQWPFPRSLHGQVIDRLKAAGARTIAYDVQFTESTEPAEDNALIRAVKRAGNVVLATTEVDEYGRSNVFGGEDVLRRIGARAGSTLIEPDADGTLRRFAHRLQGLDGFAVATVEVATGRRVDVAGFDRGSAWIDYAGPPDTIPSVSFSDVLQGEVDRHELEDKIVVVGASAPSLQDVRPTAAGGGLMSGAEVQANAIATVLAGLSLHSASTAVSIALILLLAVAAPLAGSLLRPTLAFGAVLATAVLYVLATQAAFDAGAILPLTYPLLALAVGAVGTLALHYLLAAFERQRIRFTFSRFVPEEVVNQVLAHGDGELRLGGIRRECTILFSDLRGFTTYSETRSPSEVIEVLNRYLGEMTDAIMDHGGTLLTYLGDGILAVFGAPLEQRDHADRAIAVAREMLEVRLPAFCEWMREAGHGDGFAIGVGLNSGEVMCGQIGSARRMEYTTIGDTVNTASRLEGLTKGSGYEVFIADSTRAAQVDPAPDLLSVGDFELRGRSGLVRVWALPPTQPSPTPVPAGPPADASTEMSNR